MNLIKEICKTCEMDLADTALYIKQSEKCGSLFDELLNNLSDEQKKKLCGLDIEYNLLGHQLGTDGFNEGLEKGFKTAVRLVLDSLRD
jgi:hypothetical protein